VITFGADACDRSQTKIWLQKFKSGDVFSQDALRIGRPPLTLGPQLAAFVQNCLCASRHRLAQHFLTNLPMITKILPRDGIEKFSLRRMPHLLSSSKTPLVLKHQQKCHEFHTSWKTAIVEESQRARVLEAVVLSEKQH
jgi:hypothetical protein